MSFKQEKVIVIISEFVNDKREFYPITNVPVEKARFFYKDDDGLFKVMASSDYAVRTELNETRLYITNVEIKEKSTKFQVGYEINFTSSEYETSLPVLSVLVEMYNNLIEDSRTIFNYVKKQCFISDDKTTSLVLPNLPSYTVWCMGENGEMFALPVNELYSKFQKLIDKLHKDIKDLLDIDYSKFSEKIKTFLKEEIDKTLKKISKLNAEFEELIKRLTKEQKQEIIDETNKQLGFLAGAGSAFKPKQVANIEILKNVNAKVDEVYEVLGYYRFDDRAGHKRKIAREDDGSGVQLSNGLWANIVHNGEVNVSWFGCKYNSLESARTNYTNLLKAINYNQTINITGDLYIEQNGGNVVTSENLILKGKDKAKLILCTNFEKTDWFLVNKNLKNLYCTDLEVKFNEKVTSISVLFAIDGMIKVNSCNIENCIFNINTSGRLMWWRNANTNIKPDLSLHGFDIFNINNNIFNNILNTFIFLDDVIFREFNVMSNKVNNFYYTFIHYAITNSNSFSSEISKNRIISNIINNTIINDDTFILNKGEEADYYCFILLEGNIINFKNNYIEGIKSQDKAILYDSYFGGNYLYYENNTWKNNLCFNSLKENAELMKSKSVVNKYYKNNNYIIEEEWLNKFNVTEDGRWVSLDQQTSLSDNVVIDNNYIDVYTLKFNTAAQSITNYKLTNNKINSKYFDKNILILGNSNEKISTSDYIVRNNIFNVGKNIKDGSFFQAYNDNPINSIYRKIVIENNSIYFSTDTAFFAISSGLFGKDVTIKNNNFIKTSGTGKPYLFNHNHYIHSERTSFFNNYFIASDNKNENCKLLLNLIPRIKTNSIFSFDTSFSNLLKLIFVGYFTERKNITDIPLIKYKIKLTLKKEDSFDEVLYLLFSLEKKNNEENLTSYNSLGNIETVKFNPYSQDAVWNTLYFLDSLGKVTKNSLNTKSINSIMECYLNPQKEVDIAKVEISIIGG